RSCGAARSAVGEGAQLRCEARREGRAVHPRSQPRGHCGRDRAGSCDARRARGVAAQGAEPARDVTGHGEAARTMTATSETAPRRRRSRALGLLAIAVALGALVAATVDVVTRFD